jgi:hypothetical protein
VIGENSGDPDYIDACEEPLQSGGASLENGQNGDGLERMRADARHNEAAAV